MAAAWRMKNGFIKRIVGDSNIIVAVNDMSEKFRKLVRLNETSNFILDQALSGDKDDKIAEKLAVAYCINDDNAQQDVNTILNELEKLGIMEKYE